MRFDAPMRSVAAPPGRRAGSLIRLRPCAFPKGRGRLVGRRPLDRRPRDRVRVRPQGALVPHVRRGDPGGVRARSRVRLRHRGHAGPRSAPGQAPAPWSWVTFQFVHASETHVFLNLLGLVFLSPTFEERVGSPRWAILYFAGGAFGAFAFLVVNLGHPIVLVGASAGISAVFGAYGRLYPRDRVTLFLPIPGVPAIPVAQLVVKIGR